MIALPAGLTLSSAGVLSGTTTAATGNYSFTARVTDTSGCQVSRAYTLTVACPVLAITPASLPAGTQAAAYSQTLTASGGTTPSAWTVPSGALPAGVTLSGAGVLSGTPTVPGTYNFTARATDARACFVDRVYSLSIACPAVTVTPSTLSAATIGTAYTSVTFSASGATAPYTWSYTGTLPAGMSLTSGGVLSGTPGGAPGSYAITVTATSVHGCTGSRALTLTVNCGTLSITPASLPASTQNVAYTAQTLSASGGTGPYVWSIATGALPTGVSLSSGGVISGTPTAVPGTYSVTIRAKDAYSCASTRA